MQDNGTVIDTVQKTIQKHNMLSDGDSVLVGLSGGSRAGRGIRRR